MMVEWAAAQHLDAATAEQMAKVYSTILALDPLMASAYYQLGMIAAEFPGYTTDFGSRALDRWSETRHQYPELCTDQCFARAGTLLRAALASDRADILASTAAQLDGAPSTTFLDHSLPEGFQVSGVFGAAGGYVALEGRRQGAAALEHYGCLVSTADGEVRLYLEECGSLLLSPSGRYAAWARRIPQDADETGR